MIYIKLFDSDGRLLSMANGEDNALLTFFALKEQGAFLTVEVSDKNQFYWIETNHESGASIEFIHDRVQYSLPCLLEETEKPRKNLGKRMHIVSVRIAHEFAFGVYRDLALNVLGNTCLMC